jgi:ribonuclease-3
LAPPTVEERIEQLEATLGVHFEDAPTALAALTHKSYCNEHRGHPSHNERLEFLGDAVIDLAISHRLMERFPTADEGALSKLRALLVNEDSLAKVARSLNLGELLLLGKGEERTGGREKSSVLADALEAVLGAIFLSGGMPLTMTLVDRWFGGLLDTVAEGGSGTDYKTRLQEQVQGRLRASPRYRVVAEEGPDHSKAFEVEVMLGQAVFGRARGRSKKEAEQAAAQQALATLDAADEDP